VEGALGRKKGKNQGERSGDGNQARRERGA